MTKETKVSRSKDSASRTKSKQASTETRKPCKPFMAIQTGMRNGKEVFCLLACPYCKESHDNIVKLSDLPDKCPIRRAVRISGRSPKQKL